MSDASKQVHAPRGHADVPRRARAEGIHYVTLANNRWTQVVCSPKGYFDAAFAVSHVYSAASGTQSYTGVIQRLEPRPYSGNARCL